MHLFKNIFALSPVLFLCGATALSQNSTPAFQPGEWKIATMVTMSNGKTMSSNSEVCANNASDPWKQHQPNLTCTPPQVASEADGFRIQLDCKGGAGPVVWETHSNILTVLSSHGDSYTATGTTTSSTVVSGQPPIVVTATMKAHANRIGPCTANSKP